MEWWDNIWGSSDAATASDSSGGGLWDTIGEIGGWLGNHEEIIGGGLGLYDAYQKGRARQDVTNRLAAQEQQDYADSKAAYEAYLAAIGQQNEAGAAAAASEAAAKQNAMNFLASQQGNILKELQPYLKAGKKSVKQSAKNYKKGSKAANMLLAYISKPENMALMENPGTIQSTPINLPDWMKK